MKIDFIKKKYFSFIKFNFMTKSINSFKNYFNFSKKSALMKVSLYWNNTFSKMIKKPS
jgi:hypothetical protein